MNPQVITVHTWHTTKPPVNEIVYVWHYTNTIRAYWNGEKWRTPDGLYLADVTHWRELKDK